MDSTSNRMGRAGLLLAGWIAFSVPVVLGQGSSDSNAGAEKTPVFDVISVKPSKGDGRLRLRFTKDGFVATDLDLHDLIGESYLVDDNQILSEPAWAKKQGFDVEAKVVGTDVEALGKMSFDERRAMFKQVLTERFKLAIHHETRELPVYALTIARGGAKLKQGTTSPDGPAISKRGPGMIKVGPGLVSAVGTTIPYFVGVLSGELGRTVVDRTGLTGVYDISLTWAGDAGQGGGLGTAGAASGSDASGPSLFTAIQEQLGLKLESVKAAVDVIVIDHVERPTEN
jgi:uncharacterized protein (TIGR03435 family)